ncbi:cobalt ECF transporter T component CbiQ [Paroceanicella profunda]|uniref:cobalt ECF transporter T component CbiQ n=1 Tax=Paroceanicella profunda TaxID=2579971 RepID=UPI001478B5F2|nr:cobalt ECF transporter T component CbiQ [Paroceanicella profunda]
MSLIDVPRAARRADPRAACLSAAILVGGTISLTGLPALGLAAALALGLCLAAGQERARLLRRLLHLEGFMAVLLVLLPLTVPGTPLLTLGPLSLSAEGLDLAVAIMLRAAAAMLFVFALLDPHEPAELATALGRLGLPRALVRMLTLVPRYVHLFRAEFHRLDEAMRARGFAPRLSLHGFRSYGNLMGMVLVRAFERADRVEDAMRCRGWTGALPETAPAVPLAARDHALPAAALAAVVALAVLDRFA